MSSPWLELMTTIVRPAPNPLNRPSTMVSLSRDIETKKTIISIGSQSISADDAQVRTLHTFLGHVLAAADDTAVECYARTAA